MINKALDLPFPEPEETYSTSNDLYEELEIPKDATGRLPTAKRTRAGLGAEELEDLGETGRRRPPAKPAGAGKGQGRGRGGRGQGSGAPRSDKPRGQKDSGAAPGTAEGAGPREPRQRQRRRRRLSGGVPKPETPPTNEG
jgi:hypothetical protein